MDQVKSQQCCRLGTNSRDIWRYGWRDGALCSEIKNQKKNIREEAMRKLSIALAGVVALLLAISSASAQQTVKIGVILPYSGQFADPAIQMDNGIKLYMMQHGDTVAGKKIEIIRKDTGGIAPDVA